MSAVSAPAGRWLAILQGVIDELIAPLPAPTTHVLYDYIGKAVCGLPLFG